MQLSQKAMIKIANVNILFTQNTIIYNIQRKYRKVKNLVMREGLRASIFRKK